MLIGLYYLITNALHYVGIYARIALATIGILIGIIYIISSISPIPLKRTNSFLLNILKTAVSKLACAIKWLLKFIFKLPICIFSNLKKKLLDAGLSPAKSNFIACIITVIFII